VLIGWQVRARCRLFGCYRKIWLEFPVGEIWAPRCLPIRIFISAFNPARRDGTFEVFHVVVCRILHILDVWYCWNSFIMGNPYRWSSFGEFLGDFSGVGSDVSTRPQKARPCARTHILSHHAPFYDSPFGLGVNLRKLVKKVLKKSQKSLYVTNHRQKKSRYDFHGTLQRFYASQYVHKLLMFPGWNWWLKCMSLNTSSTLSTQRLFK
jgi:hypothetical protein